jgi:hypothetical protein
MMRRLAHVARQQDLPDAVVDLVRAGVVEVFALEIDLRAHRVGQTARVIQARGPADVGLEQVVDLVPVRLAGAVLAPGRFQLLQRGHERFSDVLAAEGAKAAPWSWRLTAERGRTHV